MSALISRAVEVLRGGGLVGLPTETVYGLAADAENELAVRRIFAVKGRPESHPLIVHLGSARLEGWTVDIPDEAGQLAEAFWPGPLTLVLRRGPRALDVVTGGQDTVAIRVPSHPLAREVLRHFGGGLAAPSANRFGKVSPTTAEHVRADLGDDVDLVLDGGPCEVGVESTIVDLTSGAPAILRPGGISSEALEQVLGRPVPVRATSTIRVSGNLPSHYAPRAGVVLCRPDELETKSREPLRAGERVAVLAPADARVPEGAIHLQAPAEVAGLARVLYAELRRVDAQGFDVVLVAIPEREGLGAAVLDRLARAAAPRA